MIANKHELLLAMNRDQLIKTCGKEITKLRQYGVNIEEIQGADDETLRKILTKLHERTIRTNAWKFNLIMSEEEIQKINNRLRNLREHLTEDITNFKKTDTENMIAKFDFFNDIHTDVLARLETTLKYKESDKYFGVEIELLERDLEKLKAIIDQYQLWNRIRKSIPKVILNLIGFVASTLSLGLTKKLSSAPNRLLLSK